VNVELLQNAGFQISLQDSGHFLRFEATSVVAGFQYPLVGEVSPGGVPKMRNYVPRPYTEVAQELTDLLGRGCEALAESGNPLLCERFGLVAQTSLVDESVPPGVALLRSRLLGSWNHPVIKLDSTVLAQLSEDESGVEQCHHRVVVDSATQPERLTLVLDWQRRFKSPQTLETGSTAGLFASALKSGIEYFELVAEGGFDDV